MGGLKFQKNKCWKNNKVHTYEKLGHRFPCILYFFIHPNLLNNIGPARQQPRDWGSLFNFSESGQGRGAHLLLISFATTRLHGICNGSNNRMEDGGGGGGGHTLQPHSLETGDKCPPPTPPPSPNFRDWFGTGRGHKIVLSSATGLHEILNSIIYMPGPQSKPCLCPQPQAHLGSGTGIKRSQISFLKLFAC